MAATPFAAKPLEGICPKLGVLVNGDQPASLSKLLSVPLKKTNIYEKSARELRASLPVLNQCKGSSAIVSTSQTGKELIRSRRRGSPWSSIPCRSNTPTCHNAHGCDCDEGLDLALHALAYVADNMLVGCDTNCDSGWK